MKIVLYQFMHPWHWLTYGQNASAVATLCAIAGLIGLYIYTKDTRRIASATIKQGNAVSQQLEASLRPVIVVREVAGQLIFENIGPGLAFNVEWLRYTGVSRTTAEVYPTLEMGVKVIGGQWEDMMFSRILDERFTYDVDYESVSGQRYRTTAVWAWDGKNVNMRVEIISVKS